MAHIFTPSDINDHSSGGALLTLSRSLTSGPISSVTDCYGRSVYYQNSYHASANIAGGFPQGEYGVTQVSQIVATGASSQPMRYQYAYSLVYNGESSEQVPFLTGITVPSQTGSGTSTATLAYQANTGYITSLTDGNGNVTSFTPCNSSGAPVGGSGVSNYTQVTIKNAAGVVAYSYIAGFDGNMSGTTTTDGAGTTTSTKTFSDPNNPYRPSSVQDGNGRTWNYTWDQYGNILTSTTPRGAVTTKTWDYTHFALGRLTSVQEGNKASTSWTYYEPSGLVATSTLPAPGSVGNNAGRVASTYTYSTLGNLLTTVRPGNNSATSITTTLNYTNDGSLTKNEALGQALTVTDNIGNVSRFRYTSQGLVSISWDALGNESEISYNIANQRSTVIYPATGQTGTQSGYLQYQYLYPSGPQVTASQFDESGVLVRQVSYSYGCEGEVLTKTGSTEPVTYVYDAIYRRIRLYDGKNSSTLYTYNTAGYINQITYPGYADTSGVDRLQLTSYSTSGQLLQSIDGNDMVSNYGYDLAGSPSFIQYPGSVNGNASFSYDEFGRLIGKSDIAGTFTYSYDDLDNPTSVGTTYTGLATKTISYTYNSDGSRSGMETPAGNFSYCYDGVGRLTGLTNPSGETTSWSYLDNNWLFSQTQANGVITSYTHNAMRQLTDVLSQASAGDAMATISHFSNMRYDGAGNRIAVYAIVPSMTSINGDTTYAYDNKDQLLWDSSTRGPGISAGYSYDNSGNLLTYENGTRTYNSDNQLVDSGMSYDVNGNPTTYAGQSLTFDVANKLISYGTILTAGYTIDGLRAWKQNSSTGVRVFFVYDGTTPILELDASGNVTATNTFGANGLVSRDISSAGAVYYTFDERGNVVQRQDSAGVTTSSDLYSAFGTLLSGGADDVFGFGAQWGYYTDIETNLILCQERYLDPSTGRWLTRDRTGYEGGINLYEYALNNPVTLMDPTGDITRAQCLKIWIREQGMCGWCYEVKDKTLLWKSICFAECQANYEAQYWRCLDQADEDNPPPQLCVFRVDEPCTMDLITFGIWSCVISKLKNNKAKSQ